MKGVENQGGVPGWRHEVEIHRLRLATATALARLIELKDLRTAEHAERVAEWAVRVGEILGFSADELADLEAAALLHDLGKVFLPDSILGKHGPLDDQERRRCASHPRDAWEVLHTMPGFERVALYVLHHHENFDGSGYPARLAGEEIPRGSRVLSVLDAYDAMTSDRPYRVALTAEEVERRLRAAAGRQFDPEVVEVLLETLEVNVAAHAQGVASRRAVAGR